MTIQELYSNPSKWTQKKFASDVNGKSKSVDNPEACSWCLLGAAEKCYAIGKLRFTIIAKLQYELSQYDSNQSIIDWNDYPERTFDEVKALVTKAGV